MSSNSTFHGLNDWHKHLFEHFGWMVLAKNHGMTDKLRVYTDSFDKFCNEVDLYLQINTDMANDKKNDLKQLKKNVEILKQSINKLL